MSDQRIWKEKGWTAEIVKNEDDVGWALSMTRDGDDEPVLVVPWVMGRNKKDPKPLNKADFTSQLKAARDYLTRSEQQRRTAFRKTFKVHTDDGTVKVVFDIEADDYEPTGWLVATDALGEELGRLECPPSTKLTRPLAELWVANDYSGLEADDGW